MESRRGLRAGGCVFFVRRGWRQRMECVWERARRRIPDIEFVVQGFRFNILGLRLKVGGLRAEGYVFFVRRGWRQRMECVGDRARTGI